MTPTPSLRRAALALALPFCLGLAPTLLAQESGPAADPEESTHAKVVRYTRELERDPAGTEAPEIRQALMDWVMQNGEFVINLCDVMHLPEHGAKDRSPITTELTQQMAFGNVAFQIEHGAGTDELSRQVAAAESALKVYAGLLAKDPSLRIAQMDALLAEQKAGRLSRHLAADVAQCDAARRTRLDQPGDNVPFLGGFLRETSVVYPLQMDTWEMVGEHRFDEAPYGASLRYQRKDDSSGWVDVYVYPVGVLDQDEVAEQAKRERSNLLEVWSAQMEGETMSPLSTFSIPVVARSPTSPHHQPRPNAVTAHRVDFGFKRDGTLYSSAYLFMVDRLHAIEFRYISEDATLDRPKVRKAAEAFARKLLPQLAIVSNGSCGLPSMTVDGKIADGCDGIEPYQATVGEGMRELRFEYAPPSE